MVVGRAGSGGGWGDEKARIPDEGPPGMDEARRNNFAASVVAQTLLSAAPRLFSALRDGGCRSRRGSR